jgi:hypothetical protein
MELLFWKYLMIFSALVPEPDDKIAICCMERKNNHLLGLKYQIRKIAISAYYKRIKFTIFA